MLIKANYNQLMWGTLWGTILCAKFLYNEKIIRSPDSMFFDK